MNLVEGVGFSPREREVFELLSVEQLRYCVRGVYAWF